MIRTCSRRFFPQAFAAVLVLGASWPLFAATTGQAILAAAKAEAARAPRYIEEYRDIKYPGGDVPADTSVCTDLIVRSFRAAGIDLQREVHEDISASRSAYPKIWDKTVPDANIDHRRCPNLATWLKRHAQTLSTSLDPETLPSLWQPGDVVFFVHKGATHPWHVAIISDLHTADGMPMVIDAFPPVTSESHRLDEFGPLHSHFRMPETRTADRRETGARQGAFVRGL